MTPMLLAMMVAYVGRCLSASGRNCRPETSLCLTFLHILWLFPQFLPSFWWFGNCAAAAPETGIFLTLCHIFGSLRHNLSLCPAQQLIHHLQHCQPVLKLKNREYKDEKYFFENCQN